MSTIKYCPKYLKGKTGLLSDTARIFDLYDQLYPIDSNYIKEDFEAILSDWMVIGQDIENAILLHWKENLDGRI